MKTGIQSLATSISTIFQNVVTGVEQGFTAITGAVGQAISTVGNDIETGFGTFAQDVTNVVAPIIQDLDTAIQNLPQAIETIAQDIVKGVEDVAGFVETIAKTAEKDIQKYVPGGVLTFLKDIALGDYVDAFGAFVPEFVKLLEEGTGIDFTGDFGIAMGRITALASAEFAIGGLEELMPSAAFIMGRLLNHIADAIAVGDFAACRAGGQFGITEYDRESGRTGEGAVSRHDRSADLLRSDATSRLLQRQRRHSL